MLTAIVPATTHTTDAANGALTAAEAAAHIMALEAALQVAEARAQAAEAEVWAVRQEGWTEIDRLTEQTAYLAQRATDANEVAEVNFLAMAEALKSRDAWKRTAEREADYVGMARENQRRALAR